MTDLQIGARTTFLKPAADVVARQLGAGAVIIDLETNRIFELNESAAWIWRALGRGAATDEIGARARDAHGADARTAQRDADVLIDELRAAGLLEPDRARAGRGDGGQTREGLADSRLAGPWSRPRLRAAGTVGDVIRTGGGKLPAC
jgi:hypothetical protein